MPNTFGVFQMFAIGGVFAAADHDITPGVMRSSFSPVRRSLRAITTTRPEGPRFFPELAYTTLYLEKSTGRLSSVLVKSATRGGASAGSVGSTWNSRPLMVSLAVLCTNAAPGSRSHVDGSGMATSPSAEVEPTCRVSQYLDASPALRLLQNPSPTKSARAPIEPARFIGTAANSVAAAVHEQHLVRVGDLEHLGIRSHVSTMHRCTGPPASRWECSMRPWEDFVGAGVGS